MQALRILVMTGLLALLLVSCSVMSKDIRSQAEPRLPFKAIAQEPNRYAGQTVILGGYILDNRLGADETTLTVIQSPLTRRDEPKSKDRSEGRFIVSHAGFLDPEVYAKDRKITVAGIIAPCEVADAPDCPAPYPRIVSTQIYLWPRYSDDDGYPYYGYPYYGYRYYGHPFYGFGRFGFHPYRYRHRHW
ncbi:MAG: Slp family lipoprotein [Desulfobacterales bacterium]|nr:MAG: Slp family lipoprotein [Desulfobacterales bacterium]